MSALDTLLFWVSMNNHPMYEKYVVEAYEEEHGAHFNEEHARKVVDGMFHHGTQGELIKGEHWTIDEVEQATGNYDVGDSDTKWDVYVALHTWWHDLGCEYQKRGQEAYLISDAMKFFFDDEDAPEGKIWHYYRNV